MLGVSVAIFQPSSAAGCMYRLVEQFEPLVSTASFDFSKVLNGDTDEAFLIRYRIIQAGAFSGNYYWRINGATQTAVVNAQTIGINFPQVVIQHSAMLDELGIQSVVANISQVSGWVTLDTLRNPGGVAFHRRVRNQSTAHNDPLTNNVDAKIDGTMGAWGDDGVQVISLGMAANAGNTFEPGSLFQLWVLAP